MRIGTWNLAGASSVRHQKFALALDCDVLLLTEVSERLDLPGFAMQRSAALMAPRRHWAAVASRHPLAGLEDPHLASAAAAVGGWTFCSSVLPWRACGPDPWGEGTHGDRTARAIDVLIYALTQERLVWGGDWNHSLSGREYAGSKLGRQHLLRGLDALDLEVPTADLPHVLEGVTTIDHVSVPRGTRVASVEHVPAEIVGRRLSDHDAYVVDATLD